MSVRRRPRRLDLGSRLRRDALPLTFLLLLMAILYRRLLAGRVLAGGDLAIYFFPYWSAVMRALEEGQLPLWNLYLFAGAPLLANSQVGVFYPLNWPLWLLATPDLLSVTQALHASILLHLGLAALAVYGVGRRMGLRPWGAALAGAVYAGGGFVGTHLDHLNQLQALAWLPLLFLPPLRWRTTRYRVPHHLSIMAFAMILLAGHTQMAFIAGVGLLLWHGSWSLLSLRTHTGSAETQRAESRIDGVGARLARWATRLAPFGLAVVLALAQLLPTLQLTRYSARQGGLAWREAVSFSVPPWELHRTLVPPYLVPPLLPEGVAYVGVAASLLIVVATIDALRRRRSPDMALLLLAGAGLFLALGGYNPLYLAAVRLGLPGVAHFRAPARFLALQALACAWLAGRGLETVRLRWGRSLGLRAAIAAVAVVGVAVELVVSAEELPHAAATLSRAYTDLRPATAHLVAASRDAEAAGVAAHRFLSMTQTLFEIGDRTEIEATYGATLSESALWSYLVTVKQREVLVPNLSMAFEVPAADGYDGGLLPLRPYITFSELLLPGGTMDGRLRENLAAVPDQRWLDLMGVRFLVVDKTMDLWVDDVFYDRQFQPALAPGETLSLAWLPEAFTAEALSLLYEGTGDVIVDLADGRSLTLTLSPSSDAETATRLVWPEAEVVEAMTFNGRGVGLQLVGASLIDERLGAFYPLVLSDRYWLVHSGDVKIYEDLQPMPRAFVVCTCRAVESPQAALALLREPTFDPREHVVLEAADGPSWTSICPGAVGGEGFALSDGAAPDGASRDDVTVVRYGATEVVIDVTVDAPGVLVLTDAWYPGWRARVEPVAPNTSSATSLDRPARADLLFRGVPLTPGTWRVIFSYRPLTLRWGLVGTALGLLVTLAYTRLLHDRNVIP